ncbi:MAG: hypothetical protein HKP36_00855 [Myxococcales bacterium]|nr:hypothetical protein [Deltaproteobacteria bacterium]NNL22976.1 hypothetical protein [Myxococcales bacterium]RZV54181.1 MAG: hypothetical protein EX268_06970 [Deltaproteobacteria bacterium]
MEHRPHTKARHAALLFFAALTALGSGCGDELSNTGSGALGSSLVNHIGRQMGGPGVELQVYTSCEGVDSENPQTRCAGVRSAEIEVFFDGHSILVDFSNAPRSGTISDRGFEGYVVTMTEESRHGALLDASFDAELSSVDAEGIQIGFVDGSLALNLQGLEYDDSLFVKIDLVFDDA